MRDKWKSFLTFICCECQYTVLTNSLWKVRLKKNFGENCVFEEERVPQTVLFSSGQLSLGSRWYLRSEGLFVFIATERETLQARADHPSAVRESYDGFGVRGDRPNERTAGNRLEQ